MTAPLQRADVRRWRSTRAATAIVDWRACLDPHGEHVEVDSSHCGMSVHPDVYRVLDDALG